MEERSPQKVARGPREPARAGVLPDKAKRVASWVASAPTAEVRKALQGAVSAREPAVARWAAPALPARGQDTATVGEALRSSGRAPRRTPSRPPGALRHRLTFVPFGSLRFACAFVFRYCVGSPCGDREATASSSGSPRPVFGRHRGSTLGGVAPASGSACSPSSGTGIRYFSSSQQPRSTCRHRGEQKGNALFRARGCTGRAQIGQVSIKPKYNRSRSLLGPRGRGAAAPRKPREKRQESGGASGSTALPPSLSSSAPPCSEG